MMMGTKNSGEAAGFDFDLSPQKDAGVQRRPSFLEYTLKYKPQKIGFIFWLCLKQKMPTILFIYGWRLFFYSNESNEPIHIHVQKGDIEAKYWLLIEEIEIIEAFSYNFTPASKREIKIIIYQHFDLIVSEWSKHFLNNGKDA